jgi:hypothetical protein
MILLAVILIVIGIALLLLPIPLPNVDTVGWLLVGLGVVVLIVALLLSAADGNGGLHFDVVRLL